MGSPGGAQGGDVSGGLPMAQERECWGRAGARAELRWDLQQARDARLWRTGEQSRQSWLAVLPL